MSTLDFWFDDIIRFSLIAFILLGATLLVARLMKQPLERVRFIQTSLFALLVTLALGVANVLPKVDLAWLPAAPDATNPQSETRPVMVTAEQSRSQPANPALEPNNLKTSAVNDVATTEVDDTAAAAENWSARREAGTKAKEVSSPDLWVLLKNAFTVAFLLGSLLTFIYLTVGYFATRRLVSRSTPLPEAALARIKHIVSGFSTDRDVAFLVSDSIDVPMVVGVRRPTVLLPKRLTRPDADQLELKHSLAHEWGHVVLHDLVTWQLASLCQTFLWIQPCYWMLRRELRVAQDQLADQFATEQTREQATYARTLLELSRARQRVLPGALTMAGRKSNLYRRIEMLLNEKFRIVRVSRKSIVLSFAILLVFAGALLASLQLTHAAAASNPTEKRNQADEKAAVENDAGKEKSAKHSGVVVDVDTGKPITGATVTVTRMESHDWRELAVTESVTDENGKYTFTIPPEQLKERLLYIMFDVDHPDYAQRHCGSYGYGMIVKNLEHGEQPWFSELKMVRGEKIVGRLVDEKRRPVTGVQIRCQCAPKSGYDRVRSAWIDAVTDKDGRFELVVTRDGITKLSFIPPDHCMKHINIGEQRGDIGDITLTTGFPIHGVVKDAKGNPMSGLWVNITREEDRYEASYEMKRSAKTGKDGKFRSRALTPGKYLIEVETKATGALEKLKYANFHDTPPAAMFVMRTINVTEDSARKPLVVQAVPHVLIGVQHFKPNGDISAGHSPSLMGSFDGQRMWIRKGRRTGKGNFELMAPHGFENVELRFTTNEHSGLMVQFEGGELTPVDIHRFERLESDIDNIRVVRHPAGILKLNIVDDSGRQLKDGRIFANYELEGEMDERMMMDAQIGWNREDGMFRLSSLVPGAAVSVRFSADGFRTQTKKFTMKEGERRTVTIKLETGEDEQPDDAG